jgi:DNA-directed RNA polymerase sigma subunit (sigma70/sigma32)
MKRDLTPSQRLWGDLFGLRGIPELNEAKVMALVDALPGRCPQVVRLRYGLGCRPLTMERVGRRLPRKGGGMGVSREIVRRELKRATRLLRHPSRRGSWQEAIRHQGIGIIQAGS